MKVAAGDELNENLSLRFVGHANVKAVAVALTRSLNGIESAPADEIERPTTRGALSAEGPNGTRAVNHEVPPATDTPSARPSGAASATATTRCQRPSTRTPLPRYTQGNSRGDS